MPSRDDSDGHHLVDFDIKPAQCRLNVSVDILIPIFEKASRLVRTEGIMSAPTRDGYTTYSVLSDTAGNHSVMVKSITAEARCHCVMWKTHHICSHSVAAAHLDGCLYSFIRFHRQNDTKRHLKLSSFTRSVNTS